MPRVIVALVLACVTLLPAGAVAAQPEEGVVSRATVRTLVFQPDEQTLSALRAGVRSTVHRSTSSVHTVALSPDGARTAWLYYGGERIRANRIMVRAISGQGRAVNVLKSHPRRFDFIDVVDWSPNGRRLAFIARARVDGARDLWTIKRNGRGLTKVRSDVGSCPDECGRVIWAPDGRSIAWFAEDYDGDRTGWRRVILRSGKVRRLPDGFFGWSDDMRWIGRLPVESARIVLTPTRGGPSLVLGGPFPDEMGGRAPEIYFGAGGWIGYRTDEVDEDSEPSDRYVAVDVVSSEVVTLAAADPERGGPFDFR